MPGASPMAEDMDSVRRLEDAGAAAIVLQSLFEEQIVQDQLTLINFVEGPAQSVVTGQSFYPTPETFRAGLDGYLEQIRKIRETVALLHEPADFASCRSFGALS